MAEAALPPELFTALQDDPDVRAAIKQLALDAINSAREILDTAMPATQIQLLRIALPATMRALTTAGDDDDLDDIRKAVEQMHAEMKDAIE